MKRKVKFRGKGEGPNVPLIKHQVFKIFGGVKVYSLDRNM
jgi:hypothetical protein